MGRAHAGAYLGLATARELLHQMRIGDLGSCHAGHVEQAFRHGKACRSHVGNTRGMEHGKTDFAAERAHGAHPGRQRRTHPRHVLLGKRTCRVHGAIDGVEEIYCSRLLEHQGGLHALLEIQAAVGALVHHEADSDDEIVPDRLTDGVMHHQAEPEAVFQRTAETVGSAVGHG